MNEFFIKYKDKFLDFDGNSGFQCVDLIKAYFKDVLNLTPLPGNAIDYWRTIPGFKKVPNSLGAYPKPGDIVIWSTQPYGHIAICNYTTWFKVGVFEQNNPLGSPCHFGEHDFKGVIGWLRPPLRTVIRYTCFNANPDLMEQARQLMFKLTDGKIDASFNYKTHQRTKTGIFISDEQVQFVKSTPIQTPFIFYFYDAQIPNYSQIATAAVRDTKKIMSAATPFNQTVLNICYEFANALCSHLHLPVDDIYTPTEEFVKMRFSKILPVLEGGVSI